MNVFTKSNEVIKKNEKAIVIFTRGPHFTYDSLGSGTTGNWVVDPESVDEVDKVIIYLRRENELMNRIYLGNYEGMRKSDIPGRHIIRFSALKEVGTTESNWPEFASSGQNPVSYVIA